MRPLILVIVVTLVLLVAGGAYYYYTVYGAAEVTPEANAVASETASAPSAGPITADGTVQPRQLATLAFRTGGRVSQVLVGEGDVVQIGDPLLVLEDADLQNQVAQAQAALEVAQDQLDQARAGGTDADKQAAKDALAAAQAKLADAKANGGASVQKEAAAGVSQAQSALTRLDPDPATIELAQARLDQAQAALDGAKLVLQQATLRAPFGGTIGQVNYNRGDFVGPGMPVVMIGDLSGLRVESTDISDVDIGKVKQGEQVTVTIDALPGQIFHGTVTALSPMAVESRGYKVFHLWVNLREGVQSGLRWGMDASIQIPLAGGTVQ